MGFFKPTAFFTGAAREGVTMFEEAEEIGKEGVSILKEAKEEVQKEIKTVSDNYDKAIKLADSVGGGAFGKYLFSYYPDVDQLAGLSDLQPEDRTKALSTIKSNYDNLSEEDKARLTDGDFSEMVEKKYSMDVDSIKSGLIEKANMGTATANTLVGKVQGMVDKSQFAPQREAIVSGVGGRDLVESDPMEGGFDAISSGQQGPIPYLNAGAYGIEVQKIKNTAEKGFEDFLKTNRFKQEGTNLFLQKNTIDYVGNIVFPEGVGPGAKSTQEVRDFLDEISMEVNQSPTLVAESILKDYYLEQTYKGYFYYDSFYDIYLYDKAAKDLTEDIPETEGN